jgi:hypothetical protein
VQRIGRNADAASGVGFGLSLVLVDFLISAHASMGLAFAFGFGLVDLSCSFLARCAFVSDATECFEGIAFTCTFKRGCHHHGCRLWFG